MRIAITSDWWPPRLGGVESQAFDLARALAARGHDVHVFTATARPTAPADAPRVRVEHVDVPIVGHIMVPNPRRISTIAERLARRSPDVVHAHGMFSAFAIAGVLAAERLALPSVFTVHSLLRPLPVFAGAAALLRAFVNRADVITGVSAATVADITRACGRDVMLIPNGLTLAEWAPDSSGTPNSAVGTPKGAPYHMDSTKSSVGHPFRSAGADSNDAPRIVGVTRLKSKKRPIDLIRALAVAVRRAPASGVTLEIAGDGPQRAAVDREARRLGVRDRVTFHGVCSRARVRDLLRGAALLAQPGDREAFGLAILEARASGVPVVAMASGGVEELVEHRRHGLLARTHAEFHELVAEMVTDDALRQHCAGEAARGLERYDWSTVAAQHEAAYAAAIQRRQTTGRHVKNRIAATI